MSPTPAPPLILSDLPVPVGLIVAAIRADLPTGAGYTDPAAIPAPVWSAAPTVVVADGPVAERLVQLLRNGSLPPRSGVILVGQDLDDATIWARGIGLGTSTEVLFLPEDDARVADRLHDAKGRREPSPTPPTPRLSPPRAAPVLPSGAPDVRAGPVQHADLIEHDRQPRSNDPDDPDDPDDR